MNPAAVIACIQLNLMRCPLLRVATVQDCLGKSRDEVNALIESGALPWAFNLAAQPALRKEPRVLALCVAELTGWKNPAGQTKNYQLPEVLGMILPARDVRSTELARLFGCSHQQVYQLASHFTVTRPPAATDGPESYTVFARASVAAFMEKRRMV